VYEGNVFRTGAARGILAMKLKNLLLKNRAAILDRWFRLIIETYPSETSKFLKSQKDRFANPVGAAISEGIEGLYEHLLGEGDLVEVSSFLDRIIRIRAIQDFSPSQAVAFVFSLKKAIREQLENEIRDNPVADELLAVESRIDDLILLSFDIYMNCREKIYEIKANEARNRTFTLLERAGLVSEIPEQESDLDDSNNNSST